MIEAADLDWTNNSNGRTAIAKLQLLPAVKPILHNPSLYNSCLDNSLLDAVRKWLEPLPQPAPKGSLPAYDIQKEMFRWLENIHPTTDLLRESGIGKVVLYYTKDVRPQMGIKRQAENLMREWARPILGRSADYRTKQYQKANVDLEYVLLVAFLSHFVSFPFLFIEFPSLIKSLLLPCSH
jgi:transcription factor SPN1